MATQWAQGPLHLKTKITVFLHQGLLLFNLVHSVGGSEYGHYTARAEESV